MLMFPPNTQLMMFPWGSDHKAMFYLARVVQTPDPRPSDLYSAQVVTTPAPRPSDLYLARVAKTPDSRPPDLYLISAHPALQITLL